ncbi:putative RNA-directed DNA polymerase [Helianthus debilis subsp. tardiflorus]
MRIIQLRQIPSHGISQTIDPLLIFLFLRSSLSSSYHPMANPTDYSNISLHSLCNLITIKLSSTNYLPWRHQILPVFSYLKLTGHIDGTLVPPPESISDHNKPIPNPKFAEWKSVDQKVVLLLHSSLTEEATSETIGHSTASQIWTALEHAYSSHCIERMHTLRVSLRQLQKGSSLVSEYGRKFKALCDQLTVIGRPLTEEDKCHWFLCGLGSAYKNFYTVQPAPLFRDLLAHTENQEIFIQRLYGSQPSQAAFAAQPSKYNNSSRSNQGQSSRSMGSSSNRGRPTYTRRPPTCQLCRKEGHYASACPDLVGNAQKVGTTPLDAHLAHAFPDWTADTRATAHMLPTQNGLAETYPDTGSKNREGHR